MTESGIEYRQETCAKQNAFNDVVVTQTLNEKEQKKQPDQG
jgi:hypothetical protein